MKKMNNDLIIFADGTEMPSDFCVQENHADICFDLCETDLVKVAVLISDKKKLEKITYQSGNGYRVEFKGFTALRFMGAAPGHIRVGLRKE